MSKILIIKFVTVVDETSCHIHIIARIVSKLIRHCNIITFLF